MYMYMYTCLYICIGNRCNTHNLLRKITILTIYCLPFFNNNNRDVKVVTNNSNGILKNQMRSIQDSPSKHHIVSRRSASPSCSSTPRDRCISEYNNNGNYLYIYIIWQCLFDCLISALNCIEMI